MRLVFEMRELALMDERVSLSDAREEGLERGIKKGRKLENMETARKLLKAGSKVDFVQEITGMTLEEIGKINLLK